MREKKCIGWKRMLEELTELNHSDTFWVAEYYPVKIRGTAKPEDLVLPKGYYYNPRLGITNAPYRCTKMTNYEHFEYERGSIMSKTQDNSSQFLVRL